MIQQAERSVGGIEQGELARTSPLGRRSRKKHLFSSLLFLRSGKAEEEGMCNELCRERGDV